MDEDYLMKPGDTFLARECGCSVTVITGPDDPELASRAPKCCCGHDLVKEGALLGGFDNDLSVEPKSAASMLPGMLG